MLDTSAPVSISMDNEIEPYEVFTLRVQLASPVSFEPFVTINNPSEVITIVSTTGECSDF